MIKYTQNRVSESRLLLPFTLIYGVVMCLLAGFVHADKCVAALELFAATLLMVYLNNSNALIRIYSRMVSAAYMLLSLTALFVLGSWKPQAAAISLILFFIFLFKSYQDRRASAMVFYAFAFLGVGSLFFPYLLYLVPVFWVILGTNIMSLSLHNFVASLLGLLAPYWFALCYYLYVGNVEPLALHFVQLAHVHPLTGILQYTTLQYLSLAWVLIMGITGMVHFLRTSYKDKIRTRMIFYTFITTFVLLLGLLVVVPNELPTVLSLIIVCVAPLLGHYFALTHTRLTNISFELITVVTIVLTLYGIWVN